MSPGSRGDAPSRRAKGPPSTDAEARSDRRLRAVEEVLEVRAILGDRFVTAEVRNPTHKTRYTTFFPSYPDREGSLCVCDDFARRGIGTCKHLEAAILSLAEGPTPATAPVDPEAVERLWSVVEEREAVRAKDRRPDALNWRSAGEALFDLPE